VRSLERYEWWQRATPRERVVVVAGAAIVAIALVATLVALPVASALSQAPQARAQRSAKLAQARARVDEIRDAGTAASTQAVGDPRAAVERALARIGVARGAASVDVTGARIAVTLPAVRIADAAALIDALARDGLVVTAATLAAREGGAEVRAELALAREAR
jgi:type II secretory pathway component PulM